MPVSKSITSLFGNTSVSAPAGWGRSTPEGLQYADSSGKVHTAPWGSQEQKNVSATVRGGGTPQGQGYNIPSGFSFRSDLSFGNVRVYENPNDKGVFIEQVFNSDGRLQFENRKASYQDLTLVKRNQAQSIAPSSQTPSIQVNYPQEQVSRSKQLFESNNTAFEMSSLANLKLNELQNRGAQLDVNQKLEAQKFGVEQRDYLRDKGAMEAGFRNTEAMLGSYLSVINQNEDTYKMLIANPQDNRLPKNWSPSDYTIPVKDYNALIDSYSKSIDKYNATYGQGKTWTTELTPQINAFNADVSAYNSSVPIKYLDERNKQIDELKGITSKTDEIAKANKYVVLHNPNENVFEYNFKDISMSGKKAYDSSVFKPFVDTTTKNYAGSSVQKGLSYASDVFDKTWFEVASTNPFGKSSKEAGEIGVLAVNTIPYFTSLAIPKALMDVGSSEHPFTVAPSVAVGFGVATGLKGLGGLARYGGTFLPQESKGVMEGYVYANQKFPNLFKAGMTGYAGLGSVPILENINKGEFETARMQTKQFSSEFGGFTLGGLGGELAGDRIFRPIENKAFYREGVNQFSAGFKQTDKGVVFSEAQPENLELFKSGYKRIFVEAKGVNFLLENLPFEKVKALQGDVKAQGIVKSTFQEFSGTFKELGVYGGASQWSGLKGVKVRELGDLDTAMMHSWNPFLSDKVVAESFASKLTEKGMKDLSVVPRNDEWGGYDIKYKGEKFMSVGKNTRIRGNVASTSDITEVFPTYFKRNPEGIMVLEPRSQWKRKLVFRGKDIEDIKTILKGTSYLVDNEGKVSFQFVKSFKESGLKDFKPEKSVIFKGGKVESYKPSKGIEVNEKAFVFKEKDYANYFKEGKSNGYAYGGYEKKSSYFPSTYKSNYSGFSSGYAKSSSYKPEKVSAYPKASKYEASPFNYKPEKFPNYSGKGGKYAPLSPYSGKPNEYKPVKPSLYEPQGGLYALKMGSSKPRKSFLLIPKIEAKSLLKPFKKTKYGKTKVPKRFLPLKSNPIRKVLTGEKDLLGTPENQRFFEKQVALHGANYSSFIPTYEQIMRGKNKRRK
jgi:hypothetical protein